MKYLVYLYYLVYKFWVVIGTSVYMHSPLISKKTKEEKGAFEIRLKAYRNLKKFIMGGDVCYYFCVLRLLYLAGFKQVVQFIDYRYSIYISIVVVVLISNLLDRLIPGRSQEELEKRSEGFADFWFGQKFFYWVMAMAIFWFPVILFIYSV